MITPLIKQQTDYTCGVACIISILKFFNPDIYVTEENLCEILNCTEDEGTDYKTMIYFLNSFHLQTVIHTNEEFGIIKKLVKDSVLLISYTAKEDGEEYSHYAILGDIDSNDNCLLVDPYYGNVTLKKEELLEKFYDWNEEGTAIEWNSFIEIKYNKLWH